MLIDVVDIPPVGLNAPVKIKLFIYAFCVLIDVVDIPPSKLANPPIFRAPPSDSEPTVRDVTYAAPVLMLVVEIPLLKSDRPPTFKPPVVIDTFAWCVVCPVVVRVFVDSPPESLPPPIVRFCIYAFCVLIDVVDMPPNKLANPPIFKAPPSDSEPTVREVTYAAPVLMLVVDIPPVGLNAPVKIKLFIYAFCVLILVVDIPPPRVAKPPIFKAPPSDSDPTVRDVT